MHPALKLAPEARTILWLVAIAALAWHFIDWSAVLTDLVYDAINPFMISL